MVDLDGEIVRRLITSRLDRNDFIPEHIRRSDGCKTLRRVVSCSGEVKREPANPIVAPDDVRTDNVEKGLHRALAHEVDGPARPYVAAVPECLLMDAAYNSEPRKQQLNVFGELK